MAMPRYGASPAPSAMRPQRASRATSTIGAKVQWIPAARASVPATYAARAAVAGSKLAEGDWEEGSVAVNHVEAEDERNLQARALDRRALQVVRVARAAYAERRAELSGPRYLVQVRVGLPRDVAAELLQLPQLLFERHARDERVDATL